MSAVGQLVAYPFDIVRKRKQGQKLLLDRGDIQILRSYRGIVQDIYEK
jgi:hypothetical protein